MLEQALDAFGGLHAVINPAGILRDGMFHKMSEADWDKVIEVHLRGTFNVCRATIEHFRNQEDGAYVLFTSTSGIYRQHRPDQLWRRQDGHRRACRGSSPWKGAAKNVRATAWRRWPGRG